MACRKKYPALIVLILFALFQCAHAQPGSSRQAQPIIGGDVSLTGAQPWIAALVSRVDFEAESHLLQFCTGSLIEPQWVLTAAHCVRDRSAEDFELIIGREDLNGEGGEVHVIAEIHEHPFYNPNELENDIALVKLTSPSALEVLDRGTWLESVGSAVTVYGWGVTEEFDEDCELEAEDEDIDLDNFYCGSVVYTRDQYPAELMQLETGIFPLDVCRDRVREFIVEDGLEDSEDIILSAFRDSILCGWTEDTGASTCAGDSGGPLVQWINGDPILIGLTSSGIYTGCAGERAVSVYARVSAFEDFILNVMGRDASLDFTALCPGRMSLAYSSERISETRQRVTLNWNEVEGANRYVLRFGKYPALNNYIGQVSLPAGRHSAAVNLNPGNDYFVAIQAFNDTCNGPLSPLLIVKVPE